MRRRANPGHFGTLTRAVKDHERTLQQAAAILAIEHGVHHKPGERRDLCPVCKSEKP